MFLPSMREREKNIYNFLLVDIKAKVWNMVIYSCIKFSENYVFEVEFYFSIITPTYNG